MRVLRRKFGRYIVATLRAPEQCLCTQYPGPGDTDKLQISCAVQVLREMLSDKVHSATTHSATGFYFGIHISHLVLYTCLSVHQKRHPGPYTLGSSDAGIASASTPHTRATRTHIAGCSPVFQ